MLDVLAAANYETDFGEAWAASSDASAAAALVAQLAAAPDGGCKPLDAGALRQRQPGAWAQLGQLLGRNLRQYARLRQYQLTRLYITLLIGLVYGWLYWDKASGMWLGWCVLRAQPAAAGGTAGLAVVPARRAQQAAAHAPPCSLQAAAFSQPVVTASNVLFLANAFYMGAVFFGRQNSLMVQEAIHVRRRVLPAAHVGGGAWEARLPAHHLHRRRLLRAANCRLPTVEYCRGRRAHRQSAPPRCPRCAPACRTVFARERAAGLYGCLPYCAAEFLADVPWSLFNSALYSMLFFLWVGLGFGHAGMLVRACCAPAAAWRGIQAARVAPRALPLHPRRRSMMGLEGNGGHFGWMLAITTLSSMCWVFLGEAALSCSGVP